MEEGEAKRSLIRPLSLTAKSTGVGDRFKDVVQPRDTLVQTVMLEGNYIDHTRYLCVVSHEDEYCILGVDECNDSDAPDAPQEPTVGLVVKITWGMRVTLDGDGGFSYRQRDKHFTFKPVSVQALWTVIQTLNMIVERLNPQLEQEAEWVSFLEFISNSSQKCSPLFRLKPTKSPRPNLASTSGTP